MASTEVKTYSPDQVKILFGPAIIGGVADGTFIVIEQMTDGVTSEAGAYGDVARAMSLDPRHTITLTLQQTSLSNDVLSAAYKLDKVSGGNGAVPMTVTDLRGTTMFGGTAWVRKMANKTFSKGTESSEWTIEGVGSFSNGGSSL